MPKLYATEGKETIKPNFSVIKSTACEGCKTYLIYISISDLQRFVGIFV